MMKDNICFYEDIGEVIYRRKTGARRLIIRVRPAGDINVTVPYLVSFRKAEDFVKLKKDWIIRTKIKLEKQRLPEIQINDLTEFNTFSHKLKLIRYEGNTPARKFNSDYIEVYIPFSDDITSDNCQKFIKEALIETYRREAKKHLPERVKYFSDLHGFNFTGVSVKNMRTRWGSCSGKNKINLNIHLMSLPEHLRDYVILHELVHTIEKNHSAAFWEKLESVCPGSRISRKEIRKYAAEMRSY